MKKVIAIILTLAMLFALSTVAFAASSPGPYVPPTEETNGTGTGSGSGSGAETTEPATTEPETVTQKMSDGTTVTTTTTEEEGLVVKEVEVVTPAGEKTTQVEVEVTDDYQPETEGVVAVPVTVAAAETPVIVVSLPTEEAVKVEVPVSDASNTTVAVRINADGTETIVKNTVQSADGIVFTAENGETYEIRDNAKEFIDDEGWYEEPIAFVAAREIFKGTSEATFAPEAPTSRGMIVTALARLGGDIEEASDDSAWYAAGVQWAIDNGISDGSNPEEEVTREDLVTMLYRFAGSPEVEDCMDEFTDAEDVSDYAKDAMNWAISVGIIKGMGNGTVAPQGTATRAQVAAVFERLVKLLG